MLAIFIQPASKIDVFNCKIRQFLFPAASVADGEADRRHSAAASDRSAADFIANVPAASGSRSVAR
jgi:hypothetical protein